MDSNKTKKKKGKSVSWQAGVQQEHNTLLDLTLLPRAFVACSEKF